MYVSLYWILISNDLIIQWGTTTTAYKQTWKTLTYNISFSNYSSYAVVVNGHVQTSAPTSTTVLGYPGSGSTRKKTASSVDYGTDGSYAGLYWIAVGY